MFFFLGKIFLSDKELIPSERNSQNWEKQCNITVHITSFSDVRIAKDSHFNKCNI